MDADRWRWPRIRCWASNPARRSYGFHPNLPGLRDLYNQNALAVVANTGRFAPGRDTAGSGTDNTGEMQVRFVPGGYLAIPWAAAGAGDSGQQGVLTLPHGVTLAAPGADPAGRAAWWTPSAATPTQEGFANTRLGEQLSTVLAALKAGAFSRQAFLVQMSGFETKQDELRRQADLFAELDSALVMFYKAVSDLGMAESVTVYTDTEFNRTLTPNKTGGSLHAWGGHQLVLGGSVLGGRIYGSSHRSKWAARTTRRAMAPGCLRLPARSMPPRWHTGTERQI